MLYSKDRLTLIVCFKYKSDSIGEIDQNNNILKKLYHITTLSKIFSKVRQSNLPVD